MKKAYIATALLLTLLAGCKKASKTESDISPTNIEVVATSTGTFNVKLVQVAYKLGVEYTEVNGPPIANYDKKLLLSSGDNLSVTISGATASVHLTVTHNGTTVHDETDYNINYGYTEP